MTKNSTEIYAWEVMVPPPITRPYHVLKDAAKKMSDSNFSAIPVTDEQGCVLGIVTWQMIIDIVTAGGSLDVQIAKVIKKDGYSVIDENSALDFNVLGNSNLICVCKKNVLAGVIHIGSLLRIIKWRLEILKGFEKLCKEYEMIFNNCYDAIFVTDSAGQVTWVNPASERITGKRSCGVIGKHVSQLENSIFFPSATNLALKSRKATTVLQKVSSGKKVVVTANPVFDNKGHIIQVVNVTRDVEQLIKDVREFVQSSELDELYSKLEEAKQMSQKYYSELQIFRKEQLMQNQLIYSSKAMANVLALVKNIAFVDTTVLILGESGVGKDILAKTIHELSDRRKEPFMKINCGTIPDNLLESELFGYSEGAFTGARKGRKMGLVEIANNGTLFLDEIGELPLNLQVKLLQLIQEKIYIRLGDVKPQKIDVRIIAATNKDLEQMVQQGGFRKDLFYRLNVVPIIVPPLRDRKEDIPPLAIHFMNKYNKKYNRNKQLSSPVISYLSEYTWPGNVRELENLIERLVVVGDNNILSPEDLPNNILRAQQANDLDYLHEKGMHSLREAMEIFEARLIKEAYGKHKTTTRTAEALGINQSTVVRKLKKYGIDDV